jgi:hypothetical protein
MICAPCHRHRLPAVEPVPPARSFAGDASEDYEVKRSEARKRGARAPRTQSRAAPGEAGRAVGQKSDKTSGGRY